MRRRMLSGLNITLTLSKSSDSVDYEYGTTTFQVYCNGELLTDRQNVTVASSDTEWLYVSWSYSTGTVTVTHGQNSFRSDRSAYVTVTYNKVVSPQYTVSQAKQPMSQSDLLPVLFDDGVIYQPGNWPRRIKPEAIQVPGLTNTFISMQSLSSNKADAPGTGGKYGGYNYVCGATDVNNGKSNTAKMIADDNAYDTSWQTASSISNSCAAHIHCAARACWRYTAANRNNGDWYLPSTNELKQAGGIRANLDRINWTRYKLSPYIYGEWGDLAGTAWSSTEDSNYSSQAYYNNLDGGGRAGSLTNKCSSHNVWPFIQP